MPRVARGVSAATSECAQPVRRTARLDPGSSVRRRFGVRACQMSGLPCVPRTCAPAARGGAAGLNPTLASGHPGRSAEPWAGAGAPAVLRSACHCASFGRRRPPTTDRGRLAPQSGRASGATGPAGRIDVSDEAIGVSRAGRSGVTSLRRTHQGRRAVAPTQRRGGTLSGEPFPAYFVGINRRPGCPHSRLGGHLLYLLCARITDDGRGAPASR